MVPVQPPTAFLLTIPSPVLGAFLLLVMGLPFVGDVRMIVQEGLDHRKAPAAMVGSGTSKVSGRGWEIPGTYPVRRVQ